MRNKTTKATKPILDDEDESKIEEEFRYRPERMQRVAKEKHIEPAPEALKPENTKVRITMYVDLDILNFFKAAAAKENAAPYQTQINSALREFMKGQNNQREALLEDEEFLSALAQKVTHYLPKAPKQSRAKRAA